jgi:PIN like domain
VKPAQVHLYIDADLLGLAKILVQLRSDVTYPGDPGGVIHKRERSPCPVTSTAVPDVAWIREVSSRDWLIVTRDNRIQDHPAEIAAVLGRQARMVALAGPEATTAWMQLEVFMCQWRRIEALLDMPGPFIYTATRTVLRRVQFS